MLKRASAKHQREEARVRRRVVEKDSRDGSKERHRRMDKLYASYKRPLPVRVHPISECEGKRGLRSIGSDLAGKQAGRNQTAEQICRRGLLSESALGHDPCKVCSVFGCAQRRDGEGSPSE